MNFKYRIDSIFLSLLALLSCNDEERNIETKGYLELGVTKNVEVITRGFDVDDQSLAVDICTGANDSIVKHFSDYNDMAGERVLLDVGTYKVKVSSNPIQELDFENPTFYGEKTNVAVKAGATTPVSVECFLSCVKVTTEFTSPVQSKFKSCVARISDQSGAYLDYGMKESRAGYFQPNYLMIDLTVENQEGLTFKMSKLIENTEARDHYHLIFDLVESGDNNSGMDFNISIEADPTNDEKHNVTIPLPETGYGQDAPEVQFFGANNEAITTLTFDKGDPQTLIAKISSENIGLNSVTLLATSSLFEEQGLPTTLNLLNLSEEDKTKLSTIGLEIPTLEDNKKPFEIDFSTMVSTYLPGGAHTFTIVARDEMGHETQPQTISITVNTEVNTHQVEISDVWAHYATLRGYVKNATQDQATSYKFQYKKSMDSEEAWQDVTGSVTVGENGSSNVTQVVTNLDSNTEYEYRLVVNNSPAETMTFTTEEATALPYGDFEDDANGPWNTSSDSYWSSGNNTFVQDLASKTNDNNGQVALLKSKKTVKFAAGNAFTGTFDLVVMQMAGTVTLGKPFTARPSRLKGEYKYTPKTVDNGGDKISNGSMDQCAIYIVLLTEPIALNTADTKTLDWKSYYKDKIIAVAELYRDNATNGYEDFDLKLDYWKTDETPSYIGVLCTSSRYGDYFQGADGSELCIDNFELVYDNEPNAE